MPPILQDSIRSTAALRLMAVLALAALTGCGQARYEERLRETAEFYDYLATLDANLASPAWARTDLGLAMRVPKSLQLLPGPQPVPAEEGEEVVLEPDTRHPDILPGLLPGLVEAWTMQHVSGSQEPQDVRFYILSNHERFLIPAEDGGPPPEGFLGDLENLLVNAFHVTIPEGDSQPADNVRYRDFFPPRNSSHARYTTPKDYTVIRFVPNEPIGERDVQALLYERSAGAVQAAVLVLGPKSLSPEFRTQIDQALATFQVTEMAPRGGQGGAAGTPRPSGGGTSGF